MVQVQPRVGCAIGWLTACSAGVNSIPFNSRAEPGSHHPPSTSGPTSGRISNDGKWKVARQRRHRERIGLAVNRGGFEIATPLTFNFFRFEGSDLRREAGERVPPVSPASCGPTKTSLDVVCLSGVVETNWASMTYLNVRTTPRVAPRTTEGVESRCAALCSRFRVGPHVASMERRHSWRCARSSCTDAISPHDCWAANQARYMTDGKGHVLLPSSCSSHKSQSWLISS
jgi:hypothetical protein